MIKKTIFIFIFLILSFSLFSEDYKSLITDLIVTENYDSLTSLLSDNFGKEGYSEKESFLFDKSKELIFSKEFIKAKKILEIILFVNFENNEAQELFISVGNIISQQEMIEKKKRAEEEQKRVELEQAELKKKEEEEKKRLEQEKIEFERKEREERLRIEKELAEIEKKAREDKIKLEKEKAEQEKKEQEKKRALREVKFENFIFQFELGAVDFNYSQSGFYNEFYNTTKHKLQYGLSTLFGFYFYHPYIATGISFYLDSYFVDIVSKTGYSVNFKVLSEITTPFMRVPLYLRIGFGQIYTYFPEGVVQDTLIQTMPSVIIGLSMKDYYFNKYIGISGYFDFYLAGAFTSYFDVAFDINLGFLVKVFQNKNCSLYLRTEVLSYILTGYGKVENSLKIQTSLGLKINEKK